MSQNEAGTLTCPSCYKITPDCTPSQLPRHIKKERDAMLVKTQEQLSSEDTCGSCEKKSVLEAFCEDCGSLICSACVDSHTRFKAMKGHTIVRLDQSCQSISKLPQCSIHSTESVRFYCSSCTCLVCSECISDHKEHKWELIKDAAESEKEEIIVVLPHVEDAITPITKAVEKVSSVIESVNAKREELKENIRETFDKIAEIVKKRRSELLEEVDKASLAKTTQLDMQREGLVKIKDALQLTIDTGTTVCSQYDSVELLAVKDYIEKASQSYIMEAQSAELSPVCISNLTWVADESMLESVRNYGEVKEDCDSVGLPGLGIKVEKEKEVPHLPRLGLGFEVEEDEERAFVRLTEPLKEVKKKHRVTKPKHVSSEKPIQHVMTVNNYFKADYCDSDEEEDSDRDEDLPKLRWIGGVSKEENRAKSWTTRNCKTKKDVSGQPLVQPTGMSFFGAVNNPERHSFQQPLGQPRSMFGNAQEFSSPKPQVFEQGIFIVKLNVC